MIFRDCENLIIIFYLTIIVFQLLCETVYLQLGDGCQAPSIIGYIMCFDLLNMVQILNNRSKVPTAKAVYVAALDFGTLKVKQ